MPTNTETMEHFTSANENTKLVRDIARLVRRARLDYEGVRRICSRCARKPGYLRPPRSRRLPRILTEASTAAARGHSRARIGSRTYGSSTCPVATSALATRIVV